MGDVKYLIKYSVRLEVEEWIREDFLCATTFFYNSQYLSLARFCGIVSFSIFVVIISFSRCYREILLTSNVVQAELSSQEEGNTL